MWRFLHIVTTGTSLVRNTAFLCKFLPGLSEYCLLVDSWSKASPDSSEDLEAARNAIPSSRVFKALLEAVSSDPRRLSAELNAFLSYLDKLGEGIYKHRVILFSTDTGVGWLCTRILEEFFKTISEIPSVYVTSGKHYIEHVESNRVEMLGRDFSKGSLNLLVRVKSIVKKHRDQVDEVVFNLTGGFKPETGFLILIAGLIGANRVYYIHETMREVVEIPILPLTITEPVKSVFERAKRNILTDLDYNILREYRVLRPGEKEQEWIKRLAEILLD